MVAAPGRDVKYFTNRFHTFIGLEPSEDLAKFAGNYTNCKIHRLYVQQMTFENEFDGIWACASLLHIPNSELTDVFNKIAKALRAGGVFYCSFKHGNFSGLRNERFYQDMDLQSALSLTDKAGISLVQDWLSNDVRGEAHQDWLNLIFVKN